MSTVGVRELKNRLTHYLRRTKGGEEVVITERGRPIAVIQPIHAVREVATVEAKLAQLAAQGLLTLPTGHPRGRLRRVRVRGRPIAETILEDRG